MRERYSYRDGGGLDASFGGDDGGGGGVDSLDAVIDASHGEFDRT